jgi:rhamnosyltransferase
MVSELNVKIAVLIATYNGNQWIEQQLLSILNQTKVSVTVFLSDDMSDDGTFEKATELAKKFTNIRILHRVKHGTPAKNFHYLIKSIDFSEFDLVALSDQDDVWMPEKLYQAYAQITQKNFDAYSSSIIAKFSDSSEKYIKKSYPQRSFDYLFESAGPGCTYVLKVSVLIAYSRFIKLNKKLVNDINRHDWTLYAFVRSKQYKWFIDSEPFMFYRQHSNNAEGVNLGFKAIKNRIMSINNGTYRKKCLSIVMLCEPDNSIFLKLLNGKWISGLILIKHLSKIRRSPKVQLLMAILLVFRIFR